MNTESQFSWKLFHSVTSDSSNQVISPISVKLALALTLLGAQGDTKKELADLLDIHSNEDHQKLRVWLDWIRSMPATETFGKETTELPRMEIANALWVMKNIKLNPEYLSLVKQFYAATVETLDVGNPDTAAGRINQWVKTSTHEKIPMLVTPENVKSASMVLTNAIWFKGAWQEFFDKTIESRPFYSSETQKSDVPTMHQIDEFRYFEDTKFEAVELPYRQNKFAMVVVLPKSKFEFVSNTGSFGETEMSKVLTGLKYEHVNIHLPKFKISQDYDLGEKLQSMGLKKSFQYPGADFRFMDSAGELYLSQVIHRTWINVDEKGTEAAAATAVVMILGAPMRKEIKPKIFAADHPFLFFIYDTTNKEILFMGRVVKP